jgi:outer membrane protein assembly factor BamD (BamD/ComL family)
MITVCFTMVLVLALLAGCSSGEKQAAELLDTARFEEKQGNLDHAARLYGEILTKHPSSPAARDAAARIAGLKQLKP